MLGIQIFLIVCLKSACYILFDKIPILGTEQKTLMETSSAESTIEILEQKDEFMEEDEGSHTKLIELLSKTKNLPKILQLSL